MGVLGVKEWGYCEYKKRRNGTQNVAVIVVSES